MASLITLPHTALRRIGNPLSRKDVLYFCISHPNLYYNVKLSRLYHTVHFLDPDAKVYPEHKLLFDENRSTAIRDISKFTRTIESSESLRSLVSGASFQWEKSTDAITRPKVLRILELIGASLQRLHYAPAEWDLDVHKLYQVTSVSMPYLASSRRGTATEDVYSLFSVPTLRQVTLHHLSDLSRLQFCHNPDSWPDQSKARTSNVEYLSIQHTSTVEYDDLQQIMVWPKALKVFDCSLGLDGAEDEAYCPDPSTLVDILRPQRASLVQLSANFHDPKYGSGTLGTSLRRFPKLKRISMPRKFLAYIDDDPLFVNSDGQDIYDHLDAGFKDLYLALPPALEELVLNVAPDVYYARCHNRPLKPQFREWVRNVLAHKQELYPSLKKLVLWDSCMLREMTPEEVTVREKQVLEFLDVSREFEDVGVQFSYKISDVTPGFDKPYTPFGEKASP